MSDEHANGSDRLQEILGETEHCLSLQEMEQFLDQDSPGSGQRSAAERHLRDCARCSTQFALLRQFRDARPRGDEAASVAWITARLTERSPIPGVSAPQSRAGWLWWKQIFTPAYAGVLSLAAALTILVIAGGVYIRSSRQPILSTGAGAGPDVYRSGQVEAIRPVGDLQQIPKEFTWQPIPGAASYEVSLMEVDRAEIWKTQSTGNQIQLPAEIRARLLPGKTLLWQVTARNRSGFQLATSSIQRFRIKIAATE